MTEMTHVQLAEESLRLRYAFHLATFSSPWHNANTFSASQGRAGDLLELFKQLQMPWLPSREMVSEQEDRDLREMWKDQMGFDIDDDEAVARWSRKVENTLKNQALTAEDAARAETAKIEAIRRRADELRTKRRKQWDRG